MRLAAGGGSYMIHGTNNPTAVGMAVTHGCIRMYPEDVAAVFALVPVGHQGAPDQRAGEGRLGRQGTAAARGAPAGGCGRGPDPSAPDLKLLSKMLNKAVGGKNRAAIQWDVARQTLQAAAGMPTVVGKAADPVVSRSADLTDPTASRPPGADLTRRLPVCAVRGWAVSARWRALAARRGSPRRDLCSEERAVRRGRAAGAPPSTRRQPPRGPTRAR